MQVAEGLRVQPVSQLLQMVLSEWGRPAFIICDRFRLGDVQDCAGGIEVVPRVTRWTEAAAGGNRGGTTSSGAGCHTGLPGSRTSNGSLRHRERVPTHSYTSDGNSIWNDLCGGISTIPFRISSS